MAHTKNGPVRGRRSGSEILEFSVAVIPLFAFLFLTIDIAWGVFAGAALQHAAREGCRLGIINAGNNGDARTTAIQNRVQSASFGILRNDADKIKVEFRDSSTYAKITDAAAQTVSGNILIVSVEGFRLRPLIPLLRDTTPLSPGARAADRLE